jgi:hypothetical protein
VRRNSSLKVVTLPGTYKNGPRFLSEATYVGQALIKNPVYCAGGLFCCCTSGSVGIKNVGRETIFKTKNNLIALAEVLTGYHTIKFFWHAGELTMPLVT